MAEKKFMEFFAGGGMARLGLGADWNCIFANDFDSHKRAAYGENFGLEHYNAGDVRDLTLDDLPPAQPDLVWASFPCQDLSLAGARAGLNGDRSGSFFGFWKLMTGLVDHGRAPRIIAIENVTGLLTSNGGADFTVLASVIAQAGYAISALVIDAQHFSPQSRQRVFVFGFREDVLPQVRRFASADRHTPQSLITLTEQLPPACKRKWVWLAPRPNFVRNTSLADVIEKSEKWDSPEKTQALIDAMSARQTQIVNQLIDRGERHVGAAFKRVRTEAGKKLVRVEARFDGVAGCLRTPAGGSSRQIVIEISSGAMRSRLMTPREAARLMGLPDEYKLPRTTTTALKLCGDGVSVPVVRWIGENILTPALARHSQAA